MSEVSDEALRVEFEPILSRELEELARSSEGTARDRAPVQLNQQSVGRLARMDAMQVQAMAAATERRRQSRGALGLVFPNGRGNAETYGNIMRRIFYPLQESAGIVGKDGKAKYGFHALRHACASLMIEQGWPVKKIQAVLGHSSVVMTMDVYGHLFTRAEDDVVLFEKMEQDLMAA